MKSIPPSNTLIMTMLICIIFIACSSPNEPDDGIKSYEINSQSITNPPDHFLCKATFDAYNQNRGCDINFSESSLWEITIKTTPNNGVGISYAIRKGPNSIDYERIIIDDDKPGPNQVTFESKNTYTFFFWDKVYSKKRTVTYEFRKI